MADSSLIEEAEHFMDVLAERIGEFKLGVRKIAGTRSYIAPETIRRKNPAMIGPEDLDQPASKRQKLLFTRNVHTNVH